MNAFQRFMVLFSVLSLLSCSSNSQNREALANRAIDKISRKDWRGLYNMASEEEKAAMGIDQEQYHRLLDVICEGFPKNLGAHQTDIFKDSETSYVHMYLMDNLPLKAPDVKPRLPKELINLRMKKVKGEWYPIVSYPPLVLISYQQELKQARRARLLRAMEAANVPYLIAIEDNLKLRVEDQRLVVQGKLDQAAAFRP